MTGVVMTGDDVMMMDEETSRGILTLHGIECLPPQFRWYRNAAAQLRWHRTSRDCARDYRPFSGWRHRSGLPFLAEDWVISLV